jgi:hypothetical protein
MFHLFMERSLSVLRDGGYLGLIVPNTFITNVLKEPKLMILGGLP